MDFGASEFYATKDLDINKPEKGIDALLEASDWSS